MKPEKLSEAIGELDEKLVAEAENPTKTSRIRPWMRVTAAAACVCLLLGGAALWLRPAGTPGSQSGSPTYSLNLPKASDWLSPFVFTSHAAELAEAVYPTMAPYPNEQEYIGAGGVFDSKGFQEVSRAWRADREAQMAQPDGYRDGLDTFAARLMLPLLGGTEENRVVSPLNLYMALSVLSEMTDGASRSQLLALLGADSIDALRVKANALWNANYCADGALTSVLATSLWIDDTLTVRQPTMQTLADNYYASSYQGDLASEEVTDLMKKWLSVQTGGLLDDRIAEYSQDEETLLTLLSTVFYRGKWEDEFRVEKTEDGIFHGTSGDTNCRFLRSDRPMGYFWNERCAAVSLNVNTGGKMWLILPDEGVSLDTLIAGDAASLLTPDKWESTEIVTHLYLPKFDVSSDIDPADTLCALGVTDVFDPTAADFTPTTDDALFVDTIEHAVRVAIDEEGVTAAAYTAMAMCGAAMPPEEEIDFRLDRPFLFVLTGTDGSPLFIGMVNRCGK